MMTLLHTKALYMDDFNGDIRQVDCTQTVFVGDAGGRLRVSTQTTSIPNTPPKKKNKKREDYDTLHLERVVAGARHYTAPVC